MLSHIRITLTSVDKDELTLTWYLESDISPHRAIQILEINTDINFNVRGIDEMLHIIFDNDTFLDSNGRELNKKTFDVPARRQLYISEVLAKLGSVFLWLTYATLIITIGINPFKSKPSFWVFMSLMQMLSYIPVLNSIAPETLKLILTTYFGVSKSSIPFELLPSWIPNPKDFIAKFETDPLNSKFDETGYRSKSFIYNFCDQLGTWIILALAYFFIILGGKLLPKLLY